MGIKKSFKEQVEFNGVDLGDTKTIGHDRICPAAPSHIIKFPGLCIPDDIQVDEEISIEPELVNDL